MPLETCVPVTEYPDEIVQNFAFGPIQAAQFNSANAYVVLPFCPPKDFVIDEITGVLGVKASTAAGLSIICQPSGTAYTASGSLAGTAATRVTGTGTDVTGSAGVVALNGSLTANTPFNIPINNDGTGFGNTIPANGKLLAHVSSFGATSLVDLVINIRGRTRLK